MKVLHLVGDHEDAGGVLSVIRNLQAVTPEGEMHHCVWVKEGYRESRQPALEYRYSQSVIAESTKHLRLFSQALPAYGDLKRLLQREPFDIIHAHSRGTLLVGMLAARFLKRPVIFTNHNYARRLGLYQWAARQRKMHTVVLTPNMARHYGLNQEMKNLKVISACFSAALLDEDLVQPTPNIPDHTIQFVGVGNVIGWKKWDLIVKALQLLPKVDRSRIQCDIWGPTLDLPESKSFDQSLRALIQENGVSDQFRLMGSTTDIKSKLKQSDWFVLPSTNEPCSVALMEALAMGLPALVSESGGNVDLVHDGCGLHFKPDTPESLAKQLKRILAGAFRPLSPQQIRESVRMRSATVVYRQYHKLYQSLN